jgi:16S rRNA (adenine1518-N6/adenine1519-N6)-dimethyltransferase
MGNFNYKKSLGQHFLTDKTIIKTITDTVGQADFIFEIGPGKGALTQNLYQKNIPLFLLEKDQNLWEHQENTFQPKKLFKEDALNFQWQRFFKDFQYHEDSKGHLISNLPYNISALLLISFIPLFPFKHMTLMFQKEVGDKVLPLDNQKISRLSAMVWPFFHVKKIRDVHPGSFFPKPKVESIVLYFERKKQADLDIKHLAAYENYLRGIMQQKRKKLSGLLKSIFQIPTEQLENSPLSNCFQQRAENLSLSEHIKIFNSFISYF